MASHGMASPRDGKQRNGVAWHGNGTATHRAARRRHGGATWCIASRWQCMLSFGMRWHVVKI
jgi:hypothetical protein